MAKTTGGLRFEPWHGRSPYVVAGYRHKPHENRTPRMPEPVIVPLLAWSLKYIAAFAPDIFAARAELTALQMRRAALQADDVKLSNKDRLAQHRERLVAFFDDRRRHGRGVPIWTTAHNGAVRHDARSGTVTPPVNMHLLHLHVGIDATAEPKAHLQLATGAPDLDQNGDGSPVASPLRRQDLSSTKSACCRLQPMTYSFVHRSNFLTTRGGRHA